MRCQPSPRVLCSWAVLLALPTLTVAGLLWLFLPRIWPWNALPVFLIGLTLVSAWVYLPRRRRRTVFTLTECELTVSGGVLFTVCRRMPLEAVRYVTLLEGPVERRCGIAFLSVSGLGGSLLLEGLERKQAEAWCHRLLPDG